MMRLMWIAIVLVLCVGGCGNSYNPARMAVYEAPRERLDAATVAVLRELAYPFSAPVVRASHTDIVVGPLVYDANKQRSSATVETAPDGSYKVELFIGAVSSRFDERYLDIRPAVFRRERGTWKFQRTAGNGGMRQGGGHVDPFQWDSWLASIADPIFEGVYARLKGT